MSGDHFWTIFEPFFEHFGGSQPGRLREHFWTILGDSPLPYSVADLPRHNWEGAPGAQSKIFLICPETWFCPFGPFWPPSRPRGPRNRTPRVLFSQGSYFRPDPMGFDHFPSHFSGFAGNLFLSFWALLAPK